jgi:hypothetical protein
MKYALFLARSTELLLGSLGAPAPPRDQWLEAGMRRFLRYWSDARPGSVRELELLLSLADPDLRLQVRADAANQLHVTLVWRRGPRSGEKTESFQAARLAAAAARIISWWTPFGVRLTWAMSWPGAALLAIPVLEPEDEMRTDTSLLLAFASSFLDTHRRAAQPPRTWIGFEAVTAATRGRQEMILANPALDRFLFNVGPWRAVVRVEHYSEGAGWREYRLRALAPATYLELIAPPGVDGGDFHLNDQPLTPDPVHRWPEYYRFHLPGPLTVGQMYRFRCTDGNPTLAPLWFNPALFEACRYDPRRRKYVRESRPGGDEPDSFPNWVAGNQGCGGDVGVHHQPFPVDLGRAAESDREVLARAAHVMLGRRLIRRADVERLVSGFFPSVEAVHCKEASWTERTGFFQRVVHGQLVHLKTACAGKESADRLRAAVDRFLRAHLRAGIPVRVELTNEVKS